MIELSYIFALFHILEKEKLLWKKSILFCYNEPFPAGERSCAQFQTKNLLRSSFFVLPFFWEGDAAHHRRRFGAPLSEGFLPGLASFYFFFASPSSYIHKL